MKSKEIKVGGHYMAKVSGNLVTIRVDAIRTRNGYASVKDRTVYDVTNLKTGRKTTFESAMKFRGVVDPNQPLRRPAKVKTVLSVPGDKDVEMTEGEQDPRDGSGVEEPQDDREEGENSLDPTVVPTAEDQPADTTSAPTIVPEPTTPNGLASRLSSVVRPTESGGIRPTAEQEEILATVVRNHPVLVVEAGAGAGKTSTLKMIGETLPGNGQYTAFNSSLVAESKAKFAGSSVACNTTHSLAFRAEGVRFAHRLNGGRVRGDQIAEMLGISDLTVPFGSTSKRLSPGYLASQVMGAVRRFCQSADPEVSADHFRYIDGIDMPTDEGRRGYASNGLVRDYLLPFARKAWSDLSDPEGTLPFSHDHYVKVWQLNKPVIAADYILLDEAQDTAGVMLDVLKQQQCPVVLVGDSAQQIYEWRGAINALSSFPGAPRCFLSQSFRFGPAIAEVANKVLAELEEPTQLRLKGFEKIDSRVCEVKDPTAILCRTNAVAVASLLSGIADGKRPYLIGGGGDMLAFLEAVQKLQQGQTVSHPDLACFNSWGEVEEYVKMEEENDLKLIVKIIKEFGVGTLIAALKNMPAKEEFADLVISTAHKSKGREWKSVKLAADFPTKSKCCDADRKLLYVAVTRAKEELDLSACPFFTGQDSLDVRSIRDRYHQHAPVQRSEEGVVPPNPSTAPAPTQFTWAKKDDRWYARGPKGKVGETVEIVRKDGSKQQKRLLLVVQEFESATLYKV